MRDVQQRIAAVLAAEAAAVAAVEVTEAFARALWLLQHTGGKILTTGMGKAGHVARKAAATFCATGTPAVYLHPGEAAHGDLGVVELGDCLLACSTSGETREVLELVERGRGLGLTSVIAVTAHPDAPLGTLSDVVLAMGPIREPCPLGLTPSASTTVMMAITDALALVLMDAKGITCADFGQRHHGGYLGRVAGLRRA